MYRDGKQFFNKALVLHMNLSSVGDNICILPVLLYMIKHSQSELILGVMKGKECIYQPFIGDTKMLHCYQTEEMINARNVLFRQAFFARITNTKISLIDYFSMTLGDMLLDIKDKNYPKYPVADIDVSEFDVDFKNCVAIDTNYMWRTRSMHGKTINEIAEYIKSIGLTPLFVGKEYKSPEGQRGGYRLVQASKDIRFDLGKNLINKTTLPQTFKILSEVRCLVGTDGGLMHMCGMTDTPMVIGFTVTKPELRFPIRNNEVGYNCHAVLPEAKCKFCMMNMFMEMRHDFQYCIYDDYKCIDELTSDKFIKKLKLVL